MAWLGAQRDQRLDPGKVLAGARSVVAVALSHAVPEGEGPAPGFGEVARYARGRDYHTVVKRRLAAVVARLLERDPAARALPSCDVAPVMEKAWAQRAGLGWVGKNGCLITPRHGSWVVLGTILLDRELEPDAPFAERCGACSLCLPACPTGAIPTPGLVDARRCISFWTIERRGEIPPEPAGRLGRWVFGCDDCQTVCPWNRPPAGTADLELVPRPGLRALELDQQQGLGVAEPGAGVGVAHQVEEGAIEQLHRGGLVHQQRRDHPHEVVEAPEPDPEAGAVGRHRIEPPLDGGDDAEGPFGPDHQIHHVPRGQVFVQRVARGVLAGAREAPADGLRGGANRRRGVGGEARQGRHGGRRLPPPECGPVAVRRDQLHGADPAPHAAVAHRPGPGRVGRDHPAQGGPAAARGRRRGSRSSGSGRRGRSPPPRDPDRARDRGRSSRRRRGPTDPPCRCG